jgi:hypothetical protein
MNIGSLFELGSSNSNDDLIVYVTNWAMMHPRSHNTWRTEWNYFEEYQNLSIYKLFKYAEE